MESQVKGLGILGVEGRTPEEEDLMLKLNAWLMFAERSVSYTLWLEEADEDYNFYAGHQDDLETIQKLEEEKRSNATFNEIKPKIDMLVGMAAQARQTPALIPVGVEDEALTEVMNGSLSHYRSAQKVGDKEMDGFEHVVKVGKAYLHPWMGGENPFEPDIMVSMLRGRDVVGDPDSVEYDLSDLRFVFISKWHDEDDIKGKFPAFDAERIKNLSQAAAGSLPVYFNEANDKYRIVECWYRKFVKLHWFKNPLTGRPDMLQEEDWLNFIKALKKGIPLGSSGQVLQSNEPPEDIIRMGKKVYYAIFSGNILIEHGPSPYKHGDIPLVLIGGYHDELNNKWFGSITSAKDPQVSLNVTRRQLVHLLQTAPKNILAHETGVIVNEEEYDERSSEPNFRLEIRAGKFDKWKFTEQPQISPVYTMLDDVFQQSIKNQTGVQDALLGIQTSSREPGVTQQKRIETNIAVLYTLFKNFRKSRIRLAELMVSMIQQYITAEKVLRIEGPKGVQLLQANTQLNPQMEGFNDLSYGKYDARIDEDVENTTIRGFILEMLSNFGQANPGTIPPELLIEYSNLPYSAKQEVKAFNEQQRMMQEQARQEEMDLKETELKLKFGAEMIKVREQSKQKAAKPKPKVNAKKL
jgi:hypothetical protein